MLLLFYYKVFYYVYGYDNDKPLVTREKVDEDEEKRLEDEWKAIKYRDERRSKYPDIGDQLDDLYKKGVFSTEMAAKIKDVKDTYPKPS